MTNRTIMRTAASALCLLTLMSGCSQGSVPNNDNASQAPNPSGGFDPNLTANLSIYMDISLSDEWVTAFIVEPVQKKFPGVKLDIVRKQKGSNPDELVAADAFPDILYNSTPRLSSYKNLGLLYDMTDLIKKYNVDLSKLHQPALEAIKPWGENGELYGLPLWVNFSVLYYNKDLFDKFAVPYPQDGLTWEEAIELSKLLTRSEGGVAYRGLDHSVTGLAGQLSLPYIDPATNRAALETAMFKKVYETLYNLYKIPGNEVRSAPKDAFLKERTLAMWPMYADVPTWINDLIRQGESFEWDMAQMPSFQEKPNVAMSVDSHNLHVTSSSKNKEAAFQVIAYLLTEEPQRHFVRNGLLPALDDEELKKQFGEDVEIFKGKNIQAIFKSEPAPKVPTHKYDSAATGQLNNAFKNVESGAKDINTALREAAELTNKKIQELEAGQ